MKLNALLADDDAVSPVIGVILMVAITVILAAVIGSFVLGLGNQVSEAQPSPNIQFNYSNVSNDFTNVGVTHRGGDQLNQEDLNISVAGTVYWSQGSDMNLNGEVTILEDGWNKSSISATDTMVFRETGTDNFGNGDEVIVVWQSDTGDTAILADGSIQ